jgi:hypothetical protein
MGRTKYEYVMKVREKAAWRRSKLEEKVREFEDYPLDAVRIEVAGTAEREGENTVFTARGSGQKYVLRRTEGVEELVRRGRKELTIAGELLEDPEKEALPRIGVSRVEETPEKK